jgi:hypothetical protein
MNLRTLIPACLLTAIITVPTLASPVFLGIVGQAQVSSTFIDFEPFPSGAPYNPSPGQGVFVIASPAVLLSTPVTPGELGSIASIDSSLIPTGSPLSPPFRFISFANSTFELFLTELLPGSGPGDPFVLSAAGGSTEISFAATGYFLDPNTNLKTPFQSVFSATFDGLSVADFLTGLPIETPYAATLAFTFGTPAPEPIAMLPAGLGLLAICLFFKNRSQRFPLERTIARTDHLS